MWHCWFIVSVFLTLVVVMERYQAACRPTQYLHRYRFLQCTMYVHRYHVSYQVPYPTRYHILPPYPTRYHILPGTISYQVPYLTRYHILPGTISYQIPYPTRYHILYRHRYSIHVPFQCLRGRNVLGNTLF